MRITFWLPSLSCGWWALHRPWWCVGRQGRRLVPSSFRRCYVRTSTLCHFDHHHHHHHQQQQRQQQQHDDDDDEALEWARQTVTKVAKQRHAWTRLGPVVELALHCSSSQYQYQNTNNTNNTRKIRSVADLGCDHGLVCFGLAASGQFTQVTGIDISQRALQDGALATAALLQDWGGVQSPDTVCLDFRVGNGLQGLQPHEADVVCIAGMGVNTMTEILSETTSATNEYKDSNNDSSSSSSLLDALQVQVLVTQPTNTRPRNLLHLYQFVHQNGFGVSHEVLVQLAGRWYLTTAFVRTRHASSFRQLLSPNDFPLAHYPFRDKLWQGYVSHHCQWLQTEFNKAGKLRGREDEWLDRFQRLLLHEDQDSGGSLQ